MKGKQYNFKMVDKTRHFLNRLNIRVIVRTARKDFFAQSVIFARLDNLKLFKFMTGYT